jgi:hypothetical protein
MIMTGYRCIGSCLDAIANNTIETNVRYWSNTTSWDSGVVPIQGDSVEIKSGWNMVLDIEETPILNILYINGRLTF